MATEDLPEDVTAEGQPEDSAAAQRGKMPGKDLGLQKINPTRVRFADQEISALTPFRNARRTVVPEEMRSLRESIQTLGLLKLPIVRSIAGSPDYDHEMLAGARRLMCVLRLLEENASCYDPKSSTWMPAKELYGGFECRVWECDDETAIRINAAENLEHTPVPDLDLKDHCLELLSLKSDSKLKYSRAEVAFLCNRSASWVSLTVSLDKLPDAYKKLMRDGRLSRTGAVNMVLGTHEKFYDRVLQKAEEKRKEAVLPELANVEKEMSEALVQLEDAEIDIGLWEENQNQEAMESAKKRSEGARKRVSMASDRKRTVDEKVENGPITADQITKSISEMPEVQRGKGRSMSPKTMRETYDGFVKNLEENPVPKPMAYLAKSLMEMVLGKAPLRPIMELVDDAMNEDD